MSLGFLSLCFGIFFFSHVIPTRAATTRRGIIYCTFFFTETVFVNFYNAETVYKKRRLSAANATLNSYTFNSAK